MSFWKTLTIALLCAILVIIAPFAFRLNFGDAGELLHGGSFKNTLLVTLYNALCSAVLLLVFGFIGAVLLMQVPLFSSLGKNFGLLIIPVTLGNISIAYICKLVWGDSEIFTRLAQGGPLQKLVFLFLLHLYQYGLLFVYLFWMQLQGISKEKIQFAQANSFTLFQKVKDIYLPYTRNLWLLFGAIAFVFTFYEESKISYLFKVSQGTRSELITNWLARTYQTNLLVNPEYAQRQIFPASAAVLLVALIGMVLLFLVLYYIIKRTTALRLYIGAVATKRKNMWGSRTFGLALLFFAILPLVLAIFKTQLRADFSELGFPLLMTFLATLTSSVVAVYFGIAARLGWKESLKSFNQKSLIFFVLLFILLLVPPIVVLLVGYQWMGMIGYTSLTFIYGIWIVGHVLLTLPILGSFVLFNHFRITNNEINYNHVFRLSKRETVRYIFLSRFKAEYLLLFIIGYSFVWNEAILNNLFSDYIPSFVAGMKMLITGRGADYNQASGYLMVSLLVAVLSAFVWRYILEQGAKAVNSEA